MRDLKLSTARNVMVFMASSTDHIAGVSGATLTLTASVNGGAFGSIAPTVTDRGSGWYNLALTAGMLSAVGDFALHVTAAGCDPTDMLFQVVAYDPTATDIGIWSTVGPLSKTYGVMLSEVDASTILRLGQFQAGSTTQILVLDAGAPNVDDFFNRTTITVVTGASIGQNRLINDYVGSTRTAYLDRPLKVGAPAAGDYFAIDSRGNTRSASDVGIGVAQSGGASTIQLQADASAIDSFYNRMFVLIESGTGAGQARLISSYAGATRTATIARAWVTQPDTTSRYVILPFGSVKVSEIDAGVIDSTAAPNLDAAVSSRAAPGAAMTLTGAYDAAKTAAQGGDAMTLTGPAVDSILDDAVEGSYTMRQLLRMMAASLMGKASGGGTTTITFRDINDTKDRIVATVDSNGNRTTVLLSET